MLPRASRSSLIAVVDDDISVRESVESLLKSVGFHVNTYSSAEEFLGSPRLNAADCLILDVRLDGMSGPDLGRLTVNTRLKPGQRLSGEFRKFRALYRRTVILRRHDEGSASRCSPELRILRKLRMTLPSYRTRDLRDAVLSNNGQGSLSRQQRRGADL